MLNDFFEPDYGINDGPPDATDINQFIFYYSNEDFQEFKRLMKLAMKKLYPENFIQANASDTMLQLLKLYNEDTTLKAQAIGSAGQ